MQEERKFEQDDKTHKVNAFIMANQLLKNEKADKKTLEDHLKAGEKLSYFPFTHGDMIEKQRSVLNEMQRQENLIGLKERAYEEIERKKNKAKVSAEA